MSAPVHKPNPWLKVTESLAREVAVRDYIYDIDAPRHETGRGTERRKHIAQYLLLMLIGALLGQAALWGCGLRIATPSQQRLAKIVLEVDPRAESWTDERLRNRLEYRREAMNLIEHTLATPTGNIYPYISELSGHPAPAIDPGTTPALLMLAYALDRFPAKQRGHLVQIIVAVALALDQPDLQQVFEVLVSVPRETRQRLIADGAAGLQHLFSGELSYQDQKADLGELQKQLANESATLGFKRKALVSALDAAKRHNDKLSAVEQHCAAIYTPYRACLVNAARQDVAP